MIEENKKKMRKIPFYKWAIVWSVEDPCPYANNCPTSDYGSEPICRDEHEFEFCDLYQEFKSEELERDAKAEHGLK